MMLIIIKTSMSENSDKSEEYSNELEQENSIMSFSINTNNLFQRPFLLQQYIRSGQSQSIGQDKNEEEQDFVDQDPTNESTKQEKTFHMECYSQIFNIDYFKKDLFKQMEKKNNNITRDIINKVVEKFSTKKSQTIISRQLTNDQQIKAIITNFMAFQKKNIRKSKKNLGLMKQFFSEESSCVSSLPEHKKQKFSLVMRKYLHFCIQQYVMPEALKSKKSMNKIYVLQNILIRTGSSKLISRTEVI